MNYKTVIGLEIHVQLKTKSKMFCGCDNNAENAAPNTLVCPVCLGLPGALPVPNKQAIEWTIKTSLALDSEIPETSKFDRKHYFYPDLPKNYQISQYDAPFCLKGKMEIRNPKSEIRNINITRVHLEEDAGKLIHTDNETLVDLNRAGTPLMEIVTEPEISTPAEAKFFMQELRAILRSLSVSDANMEKGHLRADANISVAECRNPNDECQMGTPVEIKNLNSFRMVERALLYEEKRQRELLEKGENIIKETRGWDDTKGETYPQRTKELVHDYRYFPEPDIPPFESAAFDLEKLEKEIPELPAEKRARYVKDLNIPVQTAAVIALDQQLTQYFEKIATVVSPKLAANWLINEIETSYLSKLKIDDLIDLFKKIEDNIISGKTAKDVLKEMMATGKTASEIIKTKGLEQVGNEAEIGQIVDKVIIANPKPVADYRNGKKEVLGFLVGMVMKESGGRANPEIVNKILKERIEDAKE